MRPAICVLGLTLVACIPSASGDTSDGATFTAGPVKWGVETSEYSYSYEGKADLQQTGGDSTAVYLLTVRVVRSKRLNPKEQPDTSYHPFIVGPGQREFALGEYVSRCREYTREDCVSGRVGSPEAEVVVLSSSRVSR